MLYHALPANVLSTVLRKGQHTNLYIYIYIHIYPKISIFSAFSHLFAMRFLNLRCNLTGVFRFFHIPFWGRRSFMQSEPAFTLNSRVTFAMLEKEIY